MWAHFQRPYFWASNELWVAARNYDSLRAALGPAADELTATVRDELATLFGPQYTALDDDASFVPVCHGVLPFVNRSPIPVGDIAPGPR